MAHTYSHLYNIPITGLRFFALYGHWEIGQNNGIYKDIGLKNLLKFSIMVKCREVLLTLMT